MNDSDLLELEGPANWSEDEGEVHQPVPEPRAVVSVPLSLRDLERLENEALAHGLRLPEFIRHAALSWMDAVESGPKPTPIRRPA